MAETILNKSSNEQFKDDYTRYALYTTYKRVLSDMRDGLKPVQRRILWTMFHDTKAVTHTVKSAAVVGDVMKLYHPHGNCIGGLTKIYTVDGNITDIESVYKSGVKELEIKAFDPVSRNVVTAKATHFRIGTYADKIYKITATNGFSIQCTANHPILMNYFQWKNAEDVTGTDYFVQYSINGFRSTLKVDTIEVIELKEKIPMYDFTVSGYENMLIPIGNDHFVCVHNSGIYGTIKPMTNWFESKVPMVDNQGSFGNLEGDPASAERYTECKLSKFALECVIGELANTAKAVDWLDNYSNTCMEPEYLPVKVPLLLVEGSLGIGVGLRADIPAHNLGEVIDATIYLMHNPDGNVALVPDHCMACEIYDCDWEKISKTGFGHYKIRGKIDIETYKGKTALVIKSLPDMTFLDTIREKLEDLVDKKKIIQIENMYDECTPDTMRFVIVLKNGADPNYVREVIYKNTKVEQTLRINMETLYKFRPMRMSYKSYLLSFIDMRKLTKFRVYSNVLQDIQTKIHERDAYIKVLESGEIDNIIAMIRKQKKTDDSILIDYLIKKLKITDLQARYIINADLRRLSIGYLNKYKAEAVELEKQRKYYMDLIVDEKRIEAEIEAELLDIKARYGKPRMCKLIKGTDDLDIPKGEMVIAVTEKNFVRKVPGGTAIGSFRHDSVKSMIKIDHTDSIMIFDEQGRVFKLPVHKIPIDSLMELILDSL